MVVVVRLLIVRVHGLLSSVGSEVVRWKVDLSHLSVSVAHDKQ